MMNENKEAITPKQFEKLAATGEKAASYIQTIQEFEHWVTANIFNTIKAIECTSILEDFIKSNEHIIQRINKVKS